MPFGYVPRVRGAWRAAYALLHAVFGAPLFLRRLQWPAVQRLLQLGRDQVVLDVGCGDLQLTAELAKADVSSVIGLDPSLQLFSRAYVARRFPRLQLVRADGQRLPFADATVDRILLSSVLQMTTEPQALLNECCRVLKRDGRLVLSVPEAYCYLPSLFAEPDSIVAQAVRWLLAMPRQYCVFLDELNRMFGVSGAGYVSLAGVTKLLEGSSLRPIAFRRVPGLLGTWIWEACLALSFRFGDGRLPMLMAAAMYPIAMLDRLAVRGGRGCELLAAAAKGPAHD